MIVPTVWNERYVATSPDLEPTYAAQDSLRSVGEKVRRDRLQQVICAAIVEEEDALAHAPKRGRAEHVSCRDALRDIVS